jgi:HAMP domain-containing protein
MTFAIAAVCVLFLVGWLENRFERYARERKKIKAGLPRRVG